MTSTTVTSRPANLKRPGGGLALLANKCAANTFDISSGMVYASMRDQIVRAQLLVRDLCVQDKKCERILVVGAGVAGVAAATYASHLGLEVVVLESKKVPFSIQAGISQRMVGPFMYEWPSATHKNQSYPDNAAALGEAMPRCTPKWTAKGPIQASQLARDLTKWLQDWHKEQNVSARVHNPRFFFNSPSKATKDYVKKFVQEAKDEKPISPLKLPLRFWSVDGLPKDCTHATEYGLPEFKPDYIILAVGMGKERVYLTDNHKGAVEGTFFWGEDDLRKQTSKGVLAKMDWKVGVFGGGDGALQDVLRIITKHDHPLEFIKSIECIPDIKKALDGEMPELEALEQQSRLLATWSAPPVYDLIDSRCVLLCQKLANIEVIRLGVLDQLRGGSGEVRHIYKEFHFGRAYLLNRFCLHLINECMAYTKLHDKSGKLTPDLVDYIRMAKTEVMSASGTKNNYTVFVTVGKKPMKLNLHRVVVRYGPDKDSLEATQIVKITPETHPDRISMSSIPLPYLVAN